MTDLDKKIVQGIINVQMSNLSMMVMDPSGKNPKCVPAIGTGFCERCGNDVNETFHQACPSVPIDQRWSVRRADRSGSNGKPES